jgi:uncharacterized integral membrane protein
MQFLKTVFWVALFVALALFSTANWKPVTLELWGGLEADVKLPLLLIAAFLLGFLPTFVLHRARLWSLNRRIETHERNAASATPSPNADPAVGAQPDQGFAPHGTITPAS